MAPLTHEDTCAMTPEQREKAMVYYGQLSDFGLFFRVFICNAKLEKLLHCPGIVLIDDVKLEKLLYCPGTVFNERCED